MNYVLLIGRIGQDPEGGYTDLGKAYSSFSLATNERWTDKDGQRQERTEWTRIVLWGRTAEIAMQYLRKGSKIAIQGSLKTRTFTGRDGVEKKVTEVVGNNLEMLDSNGNNNGAEPKAASSKEKAVTPGPTGAPSGRASKPTPADSPFETDDDVFPDFE